MTLRPDAMEDFDRLFAASSPTIRAFPGCRHLALLSDVADPHVRTTYSIWDDEAALDGYRASDFFAGVWKRTKILFSAPAEAHSYRILDQFGA